MPAKACGLFAYRTMSGIRESDSGEGRGTAFGSPPAPTLRRGGSESLENRGFSKNFAWRNFVRFSCHFSLKLRSRRRGRGTGHRGGEKDSTLRVG